MDESDPDRKVRERAAWALGCIDDSRATAPLIAALKDVDPNVRGSAIVALEHIGELRALPELERTAQRDEGYSERGRVADLAQKAVEAIRQRMVHP